MKTVLVVDDEYDLLQAVCAALEIEGYKTLAAGNGHAALELLKTTRPDLVVSDVMMPQLSGYDLLKAMANDPRLRDVPSVLMSAIDTGGHPSGRWNAVLQKPFTAEALVDLVGRLIGEPTRQH